MATLRSLAEELTIASGVSGQLAIELFKTRVLHFRQLLLKREYDKTRQWFPSTIQSFQIQLDKVEDLGGSFYRSEILPKSLSVSKNMPAPFIRVSNVTTGHTTKTYTYIPYDQVEFIKYRRFSKLADYYTEENNRIIHFTNARLKVASVFEDPLKVKEFSIEQDIKLACTTSSLQASCFIDDDMELEESLAAAITTFFSNNSTRRDDRTSRSPQREEEQ